MIEPVHVLLMKEIIELDWIIEDQQNEYNHDIAEKINKIKRLQGEITALLPPFKYTHDSVEDASIYCSTEALNTGA